jgi:NAD(P)-dependent dehydrogenase (short-subunit alcohol dehydrogenase family)
MKTVLITGANKGIGFEVARQLAELGFFVYLGSRDKERGTASILKLNNLGLSNVASLVIDVTDTNSIQRARLELESKITALDILINNAGISGDLPTRLFYL